MLHLPVVSEPETADGVIRSSINSMHSESVNPLTLEEHRELGRELNAMNARMRELCQLVLAVYGPNNQASFTFTKTAESVERLCHDMQAQLAVDHPGYSVQKVYL
jgi:hypothetical protein